MSEVSDLGLTQLDVVGVDQEVGQVEELWDQLSDVPHVVSGGRLPFFFHTVKHALGDVEPSLWADEARHRKTPGPTDEPNFATGTSINISLPDLLQ